MLNLKKISLLAFMVFCMLLCILLASVAFFGANATNFYANALDLNALQNISITLKYQGTKFVYNSCEHIPTFTNFLQQRFLQKNNRFGTNSQRAQTIQTMVQNKIPIKDAFLYMFFDWSKYWDEVLKSVEKTSVDATLKFNPNNYPYFYLTDERVGYKIDQNKLLQQILEQLHTTDCIVLEITPKTLFPSVYKKDLQKLTTKLSSFSTSYANSSSMRKQNIKLALSQFNGMHILPHQTVSFNNTTGKRTEEKGYKTAHIILDKEYVDAVGGGVCQASTTLFNALLLAKMQIDEVHSHSLPSSYIELGFDAMVNFGSSDLVFTNPYETPVFVRTACTDTKAFVEIFGCDYSPDLKIKRTSEIISKISPPNDKIIVDDAGEYLDKVEFKDEWFYKKQPKDGFKVKAYLEYYTNSGLLKRKCIRNVSYAPQQGVKIFGAKIRPKQNFDEEFLQTLSNILGKK